MPVRHAHTGFSLLDALVAEHFPLPEETASVSIEVPVDGVVQMVIRKNLTSDDLLTVGRALQKLGQQS